MKDVRWDEMKKNSGLSATQTQQAGTTIEDVHRPGKVDMEKTG